MDVNDVYDRAYENAMRQGYPIESDILRACIGAVAGAEPPFGPDPLNEIFLYIKESPELLPADMEQVDEWKGKWIRFFAAQDAWKAARTGGLAEDAASPPLLCDFGL